MACKRSAVRSRYPPLKRETAVHLDRGFLLRGESMRGAFFPNGETDIETTQRDASHRLAPVTASADLSVARSVSEGILFPAALHHRDGNATPRELRGARLTMSRSLVHERRLQWKSSENSSPR